MVLAHSAAGENRSAMTLLDAAIDDAEQAYGARHAHTIALVECGRAIGLIRQNA